MFQLVFQEEDVKTLSKYFELDDSVKGEVFLLRDDYAVGPLLNIYTEDGISARREWWEDVLAGGDYAQILSPGQIDDATTVGKIKSRLGADDNVNLLIWVAPNKHDVSGYYWTVSQLKEFEGRVEVVWLNNLPFINEKGHIFYPRNLFEIPPREFVKAKKLARHISSAEFEIDPDEWAKICGENQMVRTLEGHKKLQQHDAGFYDDALKKFVTPDWQRASKVIQHFLSKSDKTTGDAYLLWRLKKMIAAGAIDAQGELKNMRDFEVKTKTASEEVN